MNIGRFILCGSRVRTAAGITILAGLALQPLPAFATTCSTVTACVFGSNTRSVPASTFGADAGVSGTSLAGDGVDGVTHFKSTSAIAKSGVAGFDASTSGTHNSGVYGFSGQGFGVHGTTNNGTGVVGVATSAQGTGVLAIGRAHALDAIVLDGTALYVHDTGNINYLSNTGIAVQVQGDGVSIGTDFGTALVAEAGPMGVGAIFESFGGDGVDIEQGGPGIPLFINPQGPSQDDILVAGALALDPSGNLTISGTLTQNGSPMSVTRTTSGRSLTTYASREAGATIEDVGEASVVSGRSAVALDPAFAATLDPSRPYYVFLTAEGENRGLYVAAKNFQGFTIRESDGGRSTLNVQYRIVAHPYDAKGTARLAAVDPALRPYSRALAASHIAALQHRASEWKLKLERLRSAQRAEVKLR